MNLKWYKNIWYILAALCVIFILSLAYISISDTRYSVGLYVDQQATIFKLPAEFFYRILFNPLWGFVLWLIQKGTDLNRRKKDDILKNLEGFLYNYENRKNAKIPAHKIYEIMYQNENMSKRLEEGLARQDSVSADNNAPTI
jgi:hypothetical protein